MSKSGTPGYEPTGVEREQRLELTGEQAIEFLLSLSREIVTRESFEVAGVSKVKITPEEQQRIFDDEGETLTLFYDDWHSLLQKTGYVEFEWENATIAPFSLSVDELGSNAAQQKAKAAEEMVDEIIATNNERHVDRIAFCQQLFNEASANGASFEDWLEMTLSYS